MEKCRPSDVENLQSQFKVVHLEQIIPPLNFIFPSENGTKNISHTYFKAKMKGYIIKVILNH